MLLRDSPSAAKCRSASAVQDDRRESAYRFYYITPCGKNQDFLRIFVPDFGECSAWRESAAWQGEPYFLFGGEYEIYAACYDVRETHCPLGIV